MTVVLALVIGILYAAGLYLVMRRSMVKLILGLALLAHAANLLIFTVGDLVRGAPALVAEPQPGPEPEPEPAAAEPQPDAAAELAAPGNAPGPDAPAEPAETAEHEEAEKPEEAEEGS